MGKGTFKHKKSPGSGWLYRKLTSLKTSLVFLGLFAVMFILGAIFPQTTDPDRFELYRKAGGKFVGLVEGLDLLNIFRSWYFALVASFFALHLTLCTMDRIRVLRRRPTFRLFTREDLLQREHSFSVSCPAEKTRPDIEKILKGLGFRRLRYYSEDAHTKRVVSEKGLPFRWLSWFYHLCILVAIGGFCVTYFLAFEDYLTIAAGERKAVLLNSPMTNWQKLLGLLGHAKEAEPGQIEIALERFITEYTQKPVLEYPDEPEKRLLATWGLGKETLNYKVGKDSFYPRDWFSVLRVYEDGRLIREKKIEVNDPLRHAGLTFYQIGYEYAFDLDIGDETLTRLSVETPFTIPQMEGELRLKTPHVGSLLKYDGSIEILAPSAKLQHRPPAEQGGEPKWSTVAEMVLGQPTDVMHTQMTLTNLRESSVLSYRYDPGVPLLWFATTVLMIVMVARIYLPWYQVRCLADDSTGRISVTVSIGMVGLFARPERIKQKLCDAFHK
ncbi:MAG: cytochrome c biogenesis protein ResB [Candidatus Hydrogenedentota bacterium]|nr:MAG: cytochrome c biogenesis protein ResB [Candidatus Hydrogenedentota bacterium]